MIRQIIYIFLLLWLTSVLWPFAAAGLALFLDVPVLLRSLLFGGAVGVGTGWLIWYAVGWNAHVNYKYYAAMDKARKEREQEKRGIG